MYLEHGIITTPEISKGIGGKPFLISNPDIKFNISHCKVGVACVISKYEVGIDIQEFLVYDNAIIELVASSQERECLQESQKRNIDFTKIWTLKESYGKQKGTGILYNLRETNFVEKKDNFIKYNCHFNSSVKDFYIYSVCALEPVEERYISLEELQNFVTLLRKYTD